MKTLKQALETSRNENGRYVYKHLSEFGITDWGDCTKVNLTEFTDYLTTKICQSSAHTYIAILKAVLNRYKESGIIPCSDISDALKCRNEMCQKVYLTEEELASLEKVIPWTNKERFVLYCFLISAKTGMRMSDTLAVTSENISDGILTYVSKKTSIQASVPVSDKVIGWIKKVNDLRGDMPNKSNYDLIIKRLCERAGITRKAKAFKAGKSTMNPKFELVSSHTARVTFCTILSQKGVPIMDICQLAGHSNPQMTSNYIVRTTPKLNKEAMDFLK